MKEIDVYQVNAFTGELSGGNPAGVVTHADALTDAEMQHVAWKLNLSETAFVLEPTTDEADLRLRFFTPSGDEIDFCGHATVGALFQLASLDMFELGNSGKNTVNVETKADILPATITNKDRLSNVTFGAPRVDMMPYRLQGEAFATAFGVPTELIKPGCTILLDKKLNYVYVPASSLQMLGKQAFDFSRIREQFGDEKEKIVVFSLFSNETVSDTADLHARGLAPLVGVDEDPFTGSMQAGLVSAAKRNGYIDAGKKRVMTEQGHFIGRPGSAEVSHDTINNEFTITANAVRVFSSKWRI